MNGKQLAKIKKGQSREYYYSLTQKVYEEFLLLFEDTNPIHIDDHFAQRRGFKHKIMHEAIVNGFLSHFIGVVLPGHGSLIQKTELNFIKPVYLLDDLRIEGTVKYLSAEDSKVVIDVQVYNQTQGYLSVEGQAEVVLSQSSEE